MTSFYIPMIFMDFDMQNMRELPSFLKTKFIIIFYFFISSIIFFDSPSFGQNDFIARMFTPKEVFHLLPDFTDSYGVVFRDLNQDGLPDIYVVRFRNLNRLFINEENGRRFIDFTIPSRLGGNLNPRGKQNLELGASAGDFNNDGLSDMVIAGWGVSTSIFKQNKDHSFSDITDKLQLSLPLDGNCGIWADVNLDGNLDLFITDEHHPNRLLLGDGRGNFRDVSAMWGLTRLGTSQGAAFADVDADGYPDLYVCNWFGPDVFYRNVGGEKFEEYHLELRHLTENLNSNGVAFGDVDNDGDLDLIVTDRNGHSELYRNDTAPDSSCWIFKAISQEAGVKIPYPAYGPIIADFNNDGWQDIWVNCIGPELFFLNKGFGQFEKKFESQLVIKYPQQNYSTGAAVADFDLDGDLDLFVANKDTHSVLYVNPTNNQRFVQLKLVGVKANRDAIGAKIWLYEKEETKGPRKLVSYHEVGGGGGYLSQNTLVVHFAVNPGNIYQARIKFPGGRNVIVDNIRAGEKRVVYEFEGFLKSVYRFYQLVYRITGQQEFWIDFLLFLGLLILIIGFTYFANARYFLSARQVAFFITTIILLLYGIFLALQFYSIKTRLIIQISLLILLFLVLLYFLEKIRKLELARAEYRHLLQDFSQDLIFIKENQKIYASLVNTIFQAVHPEFCVYYENKNNHFIKIASAGDFTGPDNFRLPEKTVHLLLSHDAIFKARELEIPGGLNGQLLPIRRSYRLFGLLVFGTFRKPIDAKDEPVFRTLATQTAIAIENNLYIEETKRLIQKVTEAETREKYIRELEKKNEELQQLYRNLQETQAQLIHSEKMAGLGQLVAGVAHELNNPISFVYANMIELDKYITAINELLRLVLKAVEAGESNRELTRLISEFREKYELDFIQEDIQSLISDCLEGSRRVKDVVLNLRNFSRLDEADYKWVDIHEGLNSTLLLLNNEIKNRIHVHKDYDDLPKVYCQPGQINQVFMNLLMNAIQAIPEKGNIWIQTRKKDKNVELSIRDDGVGIPQSIQNKIFDPFFTTKPVGRGTGLGLSISYKIIQDHGGSIRFESKENEGTTFYVTLPVQGKDKNEKV